jgi:hypothetical protein
MKKYFQPAAQIKTVVLTLLMLQLLLQPAVAAASTVSESYGGGEFTIGMIVSLKGSNPNEVELANVNNAQYIFGVVTEADEALLAFTNSNNRANVATFGEVLTYVSDINGDISEGDFIVASQINGVGMKGDANSSHVLGVAASDFSETSTLTQVYQLDSLDKEAAIGPIPVRLLARDFSASDNQDSRSSLEKLGERIVGKPVSLVQVIVAVALFMMTLGISGVVLYGAIRGTFRSIGRNPLASKSIFNNLFQVVIVSISVMLIGLFAGYLILLL